MRLVYYSLAAVGNLACERRWIHSIRSLRRYNREIPVYLVAYGTPHPESFAEAARLRVQVIDGGAYAKAFSHVPVPWAAVLTHNPTLHKVLALRLCPTEAASQVLYLDSDTFFFGDVGALFDRYGGHHFVAREEPGSRRSHYGYDPSYIDEGVLGDLASQEGLRPVPPYNTGVFLMNGGLWHHLGALSDTFLIFAWRLTVGLRLASPLGASPDNEIAWLLDRSMTEEDQRRRLVYPSSNAWIVEEVALWLTLGQIPGLTHSVFQLAHVMQNGEFWALRRGSNPLPVVAHYFSGLEEPFLAWARDQ
jgi:hypothetical protein